MSYCVSGTFQKLSGTQPPGQGCQLFIGVMQENRSFSTWKTQSLWEGEAPVLGKKACYPRGAWRESPAFQKRLSWTRTYHQGEEDISVLISSLPKKHRMNLSFLFFVFRPLCSCTTYDAISVYLRIAMMVSAEDCTSHEVHRRSLRYKSFIQCELGPGTIKSCSICICIDLWLL